MTSEEKIGELNAAVLTLQMQTRRLWFVILSIAAAAVFGLLISEPRHAEARVASNAEDSVLTLRELVIVDQRGTPRVRIAAPLPDPIMLGKRFNRGEAVSGILIYDGEGNERGGYITDESRNAALTLDEIMRASVHIGVSDRGESHMSLSDGLGGYGLMGINQRDGAFVRLHGQGRPTVFLPDTARKGN
jgi:hypothetical protein